MQHIGAIHPGEILRLDFMEPLGISAYRLAHDIQVDPMRISGLLNGQRGITPDTAMRLARYFQMTPEFWMNLQNRYELDMLRYKNPAEYESIKPRGFAVTS